MEQGKRNASSLQGGRGELYAALIHEVAPNGQHRAASVLSTDRTRCQNVSAQKTRVFFSTLRKPVSFPLCRLDRQVGWGSAGSADCETGADGAVAGGGRSETAFPTRSFLSVLRVT